MRKSERGMRLSVRSGLLAVAWSVFGIVARADDPAVEAARDDVNEAWTRIVEVGRDQSNVGEGLRERQSYWLGVMQNCEREFNEAMSGDHIDARAEAFVAHFGIDGAAADFRWLLCMPGACFNVGGGGLYEMESRAGRAARLKQLAIAKALTNRLLRDRDTLKRYHQCNLWLNWMFRRQNLFGYLLDIREGLKRPATYWWHARDVVVLLYATSREDLLPSPIKADELLPVYEEWGSWFAEHGADLVPVKDELRWDRDPNSEPTLLERVEFPESPDLPPIDPFPTVPFPDWKGIAPLSGAAIRELT